MSGTLFPGLPFGLAIAVCALVAGSVWSQISTAAGVATIVLLAVAARLFGYLFPASMLTFDPDAYAVRSLIIANTGHTGQTVSDFYGAAAGFPVFGAEVKLVTGLPVEAAYAVFPLLVGFLLTLFASVLARRVTSDRDAPIVAAAVVAVGASSLMYGMAPTPQSLAAIYLAGSVVILMATVTDRLHWRHLFLLSVFLLAGALTHKIPLLLFTGISCVLVGYSIIIQLADIRPTPHSIGIIAALGATALAFQWIYLTGYFERGFLKIFRVFGFAALLPSFPVGNPTAATVVDPPLTISIRNTLYFFVTVGTGGIVALELFRRYSDAHVRLLQAAAGVTVGVILPGFVGLGPGFQRTYMYATVFVAALIGVGAKRLVRSGRFSARPVAVGMLLVILVANPFSVIAMSDFPNTPRQYLSVEEVEGKHFANDRIEQIVYMDLYYGDETVDFEAAARGDEYHQYTVPDPRWVPGLLNNELLNQTLLKHEYPYIAIRTNVEIYRLKGGWYRLTWSPERALDSTHSYQRIYDNGGVTIHARG